MVHFWTEFPEQRLELVEKNDDDRKNLSANKLNSTYRSAEFSLASVHWRLCIANPVFCRLCEWLDRSIYRRLQKNTYSFKDLR